MGWDTMDIMDALDEYAQLLCFLSQPASLSTLNPWLGENLANHGRRTKWGQTKERKKKELSFLECYMHACMYASWM